MTRRLGRFGAAAVLAVSVVAVMGSATAGTDTSSTDLHLVLPADEATGVIEDVEHDGLGLGDRTVFRGPLYQGDTQVGRSFGECVVVSNKLTQTKGLWRCSYLVELAEGDLVIEGIDPRGPGSSFFAILGGTGAYRTARGDAELIDVGDVTEYHLHIES